ncbi:thiamine-phosphate pyrophosphorylase [Evansella caseinilytica]|uniref:Thiamine-phosphate synthase n=1 Tax=Evansella caseinilytica TaxID=1503961 RepID=A0A1H3GSQ2_9BACI|nr:thiamine phosphate synthase [Evansella caseinilytica]SDY06301.1 thiamine-phosphate pyrophosphorylase [Evansella caseinilytica]
MARIRADKMRALLKVYFISGSTNTAETELANVLAQAIAGGVTLFQFREKGRGACSGAGKTALGKKLQAVCQKANVPFIVNDDVALALELDADGVHIGQEDGSAAEVRRKIGDRILGVSTHNVAEAKQAIADGADYLGVGPVFATSTKADTRAVCGPEFIARLREEGIHLPIVAIGGIHAKNAVEVVAGKADGLSVITAISNAADPKAAAQQLSQVWK